MSLPALNYATRRADRRYFEQCASNRRERELVKLENQIYDEVTGIYYADHRAAFIALVMAGKCSEAFEDAVRREAVETYNIIH